MQPYTAFHGRSGFTIDLRQVCVNDGVDARGNLLKHSIASLECSSRMLTNREHACTISVQIRGNEILQLRGPLIAGRLSIRPLTHYGN